MIYSMTKSTDQKTVNAGKGLFIISLLLAVLLAIAPAPGYAAGPKLLQFDVAESGPKFVYDEAPVFPDQLPAYGNAFVTQGYIYPYGTLTASNGVNPDGSPEFPELVLGEWTCRGYFIGDGAYTVTGPWVITTQLYDFYDQPGYAPNKSLGENSLISEGYELVDDNVPGKRALTGGTGTFRFARGQSDQTKLGHNISDGVNLRFEMHVQ